MVMLLNKIMKNFVKKNVVPYEKCLKKNYQKSDILYELR